VHGRFSGRDIRPQCAEAILRNYGRKKSAAPQAKISETAKLAKCLPSQKAVRQASVTLKTIDFVSRYYVLSLSGIGVYPIVGVEPLTARVPQEFGSPECQPLSLFESREGAVTRFWEVLGAEPTANQPNVRRKPRRYKKATSRRTQPRLRSLGRPRPRLPKCDRLIQKLSECCFTTTHPLPRDWMNLPKPIIYV
jgi:hypothetical protein